MSVTVAPIEPPEPVALYPRSGGVSTEKMLRGHIVERRTWKDVELGSFTMLVVDAVWPYNDHLRRMYFSAADNIEMGLNRCWRLQKEIK